MRIVIFSMLDRQVNLFQLNSKSISPQHESRHINKNHPLPNKDNIIHLLDNNHKMAISDCLEVGLHTSCLQKKQNALEEFEFYKSFSEYSHDILNKTLKFRSHYNFNYCICLSSGTIHYQLVLYLPCSVAPGGNDVTA